MSFCLYTTSIAIINFRWRHTKKTATNNKTNTIKNTEEELFPYALLMRERFMILYGSSFILLFFFRPPRPHTHTHTHTNKHTRALFRALFTALYMQCECMFTCFGYKRSGSVQGLGPTSFCCLQICCQHCLSVFLFTHIIIYRSFCPPTLCNKHNRLSKRQQSTIKFHTTVLRTLQSPRCNR